MDLIKITAIVLIWCGVVQLMLRIFPMPIITTRVQWPTRDRVIPPLIEADHETLSEQWKKLRETEIEEVI